MEIKTAQDVKIVSDTMHDSEFEGGDFDFNSAERKFFLNTHYVNMQGGFFFQRRSPVQERRKHFHLEFWNVVSCDDNLDKVCDRKGLCGVFNYIKIRKNGQKLTIISQDLHINLELSELEGRFEIIENEQ